MVESRLVVLDLAGSKKDEVPVSDLEYGFVLNGPGVISFNMPLEHPKCVYDTLAPGERWLEVWRGNARAWGGYLWSARPNMAAEKVDFAGASWPSIFSDRHVDALKSYAQKDQTTEIAWDLVNFTQSKSLGNLGLGFTNGSVASGVLRDRTYFPYERKNLLDALQELAAVENGFDWEITPDRVFKTYYPSKGVATAHVFELGKNIDAPTLNYSGRVVTEMTGIGAGEGDTMLISTQADVQAQTQFGLRQKAMSWKDVSVQATLDAHAKEQLRLRKNVIQSADDMNTFAVADLPFGAVTEGDVVRIRAKRGYVDLDVQRRVVALKVRLDEETSEERISLTFDRRLEE